MHQLFDDVIGTPPPTAIDSRALVRRDRRVRATRWSTLGATAVAAGIAVVALTTATTPAGTPPVGAPPTGASSGAPDNRLELRSATRQEAEVSAGQLKVALDAAVRAAVPTATWDTKGFTVTVIDYVTPIGWIGDAGVRFGGTSGSVSVMLHSYPTAVDIDPLTCAAIAAVPGKEDEKQKDTPAMPPCVEARTPSGKPVVTYAKTTKTVTYASVLIGMADNRVMTVQVGADGSGPPVLSLEQLIAIAQQATDRIR